MTTTKQITVEELMALCISELGFEDRCSCNSGCRQWSITIEAETCFADGPKASVESVLAAQATFCAFLKKHGVNVQKLVELRKDKPYGYFRLSSDGLRLALGNGTGCLQLREICEFAVRAIDGSSTAG